MNAFFIEHERRVMRSPRNINVWLVSISASAASAAFAPPSRADSEVSLQVFEYGAWTLVPVFYESAPTTELAGFYACPLDIEIQNGNFSRLWFEFDGTDQWTAEAVDPADFQSFGAYLDAIGVNAGYVGELEDAMAAGGAPSTPAPSGPLVGGLLENDPMLPAFEAADPATIADYADLYTALGAPAAPILTATLAEGAAQSGQAWSAQIDGEIAGALNCIASTALFTAGATAIPSGLGAEDCMALCACTTTYGPFTPTPPGAWPPPGTTTVGDRKKCEYTRNGTVTFTKTGRKWYCPSCAATGTTAAHEYGAEDVLSTDPCPPAPTNPVVVVP